MELPSNWTTPLDRYTEVPLVPGTQEYRDVDDHFLASLTLENRVLEIIRVQNPQLYRQYARVKKETAQRLNMKEDQVETTPLWHGTDEISIHKITTDRFKGQLSGRNGMGAALGYGSYFAKNASYSAQNQYSKPNAHGHKYIIQTRVITGEWCQGNQQMRVTPYKDQSTEQYDSVVDNPHNPAIFVIFNDTSAYPEYIIKFQ